MKTKLRISSWAFPLATVAMAATGAAVVVNCGTSESPSAEIADEDLLGVNNALGLGVLVEQAPGKEADGRVLVTLSPRNPSYALGSGDKLFVRLRQGKITDTSQRDMSCDEVAKSGVTITSSDVATRTASGKVVYKNGPAITQDLIDAMHLYEDPGWAGGAPSAHSLAVAAKGVDPIVEACVVGSNGKPRAKLQTTLGFAWDEGSYELGTYVAAESAHVLGGADAGAGDAGTRDGGAGGTTRVTVPRLTEGTQLASTIAYAQLCEQELGENPFFPKRAVQGTYDTFDLRDLQGNKADGTRAAITGIEGATIPVLRDGQPVTACDPGRELGRNTRGLNYDCLKNTDSGMYLMSGDVQPGPVVATAKNSRGTHWVLLGRSNYDDGSGMMKTKRFNDIAMIGNNPRTGKTCYFQNSVGEKSDGAHIPNPADVNASATIWSASPSNYCGDCHSKSAFVHSRWIDGALRSNGKSIVPKLGENPDYVISNNSAPFYFVNGDAQGFYGFAKPQLISEETAACATCHRVTLSKNFAAFTKWSTSTELGVNSQYPSQAGGYVEGRSATGKTFAGSHWMPLLLTNLDETNWATSAMGKAAAKIVSCAKSMNAAGVPTEAGCETAPVPRGNNRQAPR